MKTGPKGLALIKGAEGCRLEAYPDPGTGAEPWTIGYGSTGPDVKPGLCISQEEAERRLRRDLERFERAVTRLVTVPITQEQFDALVSFAFNCGPENLARSTLLKRVNNGEPTAAAAEFRRWNRAAGRVLSGLTKRRAAEAALFLSAQS
jgi:lysozyme